MAQATTEDNNMTVPSWLNQLEIRLKTVMQSHQLGHEKGAGSACLKCQQCPGLDLHYWRKQCIACKCKKEDHDIPPDDSILRFEILLTNPDSKRYKTFCGDLEMQLMHSHKNAGPKQFAHLDNSAPVGKVTFDWLPPDTPSELAAAYMSALPSNKLPITGSYGARYRQAQLGIQIPLYDISPEVRHKLSSKEQEGFQSYLEDVRRNVGMGKIQRICQKSFLEESMPHHSLQKPVIAKNLRKNYEQPANADNQPMDISDQSNCTEIEAGIKMMGINNNNKMNFRPIRPFQPFKPSPDLSQTSNIDSSKASSQNTPAITLRTPSAFVPVNPKNKLTSDSKPLGHKAGSNNLPANFFSKQESDSREDSVNPNLIQSEITDVSKPENEKHSEAEPRPQNFLRHNEKPKNMPYCELNVQLGFDSHPQNYTAVKGEELSDSLKNTGLDLENANSSNLIATEHIMDCWYCKKPLPFGSVAVATDRAGNDKVWHPQCFVCCVCKELLVDLVYFYYQDEVYCGRHYAEKKNISRCYACDELIFVNEFTYADGRSYHVNHFCCVQCDLPLAGKKYVLLGNAQPNCLDCYDTKFSNICRQCDLPIRAEQQGVKLNNLNWHATPACFKCAGCSRSLISSKFVLVDSKPYCSKQCVPTP